MRAGDLGILLVSTDNTRSGDHCLILEEPYLAKVGAWGVQEEVRIFYKGLDIRVPAYFVRVIQSPGDSQE